MMGRVHLALGSRYLQDGQLYVVRQILRDGRLLSENQSAGGHIVTMREEVIAAWARGLVTFDVRGGPVPARPTPTSTPPSTPPADTSSADFSSLPEPQRAEAWRRYRLIQPLLALPAHARTRQTIAAYAAHVAARAVEAGRPVEAHAGPAPPEPPEQPEQPRPASRGSIERYLRAFERSGGDVRSLVPATERCGGPGRPRLDPEIERIVQGVLAECAAAPAYRTTRDVFLLVATRLRDENHDRALGDRLALPHPVTVYRRIRAAGVPAILRRRQSAREAQAEAAAQPGPRPTHILERVELDDTPLDLILVDEDDRLPIGRPTVTLALDVFSGFPTGVYVGFEPASYGAAMRCLLHSILPKEEVQARYGTKHPWPAYGLPETLVVDRAPHLRGPDLANACGQLSIHLQPAPVRRPWFKGAIERQFHTHNTGLIHTLPGSTFSNVVQRGDYDAGRYACIALTRFWEILHVYLLDYYAQDYHKDLHGGGGGGGGIPARRWAQSVAAGWAPALYHDAAEVRILLGRTATRTIQRTGIDFQCLRYQSPELGALRQRVPAGTPVTLKYDPEDLGTLAVRDPAPGGRWLTVPAVDQRYARGLSLWKHRIIHAYVVRTLQQEIDIYALAAAKERIREIVDDEFRRTRRGKSRRTLARAREARPPATPERRPLAPGDTAGQRPAALASPPPVIVLPSIADTIARDTGVRLPDAAPGFGGDYNLPR